MAQTARVAAPVLAFAAVLAPLGAPSARADGPEGADPAPGHDQAQVPPVDPPSGASGEVARFGAGLRTRWISVPRWFLDLFLAANEPLSTYGVGVEVFRRKSNFDIALGFGYQNMSPRDGNWLGRGYDPSIETDFMQFRGLGLLALDMTFSWRKPLGENVGFHTGVGLGLGIVTGELLRTSNSTQCTRSNAGNEAACRPAICPPGGCTEEILRKSEEGAGIDGPDEPHRFAEDDVPGALPILNLTVGLDLALPRELPGFELRLEGGFNNAFFLGTTAGYLF